MRENKRFAVVPAGRRSGKTELAKRRLVMGLPEKKGWADPRYFAAAPTRDQAKRIFWKDLLALVPEEWISRVYSTDLCVVTKFKSELWVVGLDKPQRIEGTPWDGGVLDEYANMKPGAWTENIRPALSDRQGWCWFIGVPEGLNHYRDLVDYAASEKDPQWGVYSWFSADILPPEELAAAKRVLDAKTFRQEYEGSFEGASGRAYYAYDPKKHEDASIRINEKLPIFLCCDFNVDPCVWEAAQSDGRTVWVVDEITMRDTNTVEMGREALRRFSGHAGGIVVYGDAAGMNRSTTGKTDYAILAGLGLTDQRLRKANPHVKDRVNGLNAMLESTSGTVRLFHHPRCRMLKKDFETVEWRENGAAVDKSNTERTHAVDALGYFIEYEFPIRAVKRDPAKRFYK